MMGNSDFGGDFNYTVWAGNQTFSNHSLSMDEDLIHNKYVQTVYILFYIVIFTIGVIGNMLVCYVVLRNKAMQTVTNIFITNLALSDILLCILAVPFTPLYTFLARWVFGALLCRLVPYAQSSSIYISTLTLTAIAVDRFFVIIYPFHPRMKLTTCIIIVICIWVVSLLLSLPYGIYMKLMPSDYGYGEWLCEEDWPSEHYRKIYGSVTSTLQFVIPFIVISVCYVCVSYKLNNRVKSKPGTKTSQKEEADRDRKKRTNRMLIAMVAVFAVSWLPINLFNIVSDFADFDNWIANFIFYITHTIACSSTCYNPFLYAWLNENFRKEFKQVLPCFRRSGGLYNNIYTRTLRTERANCNGNENGHETMLLANSTKRKQEIIPRGPTCNDNIKVTNIIYNEMSQPIEQNVNICEDGKTIVTTLTPTSNELLSGIKTKTIVSSSGLLETPFDLNIVTMEDNDGRN